MSTQPEALRLADELGRLANLEANDLADCMEEAAVELLRLHAEIEAERQSRQAAQIENEALKARIARADVELQRAVIAEREACAKLCEMQYIGIDGFGSIDFHVGMTRDQCAAAIRARGAA